LSFKWQGGVELHPRNIGLVSCRHVSTNRTLCAGALSTCDCQSASCPATEPCDCGLQGRW
jgi:hypothetical protein